MKAGFGQLVLCYGGILCKMLNRPECVLITTTATTLCLNHLKCLFEKFGEEERISFILCN